MIWEDDPPPASIEQLEKLGFTRVVIFLMNPQPEEGDFLDGNAEEFESAANELP
jgi:hypothetical protein